MLLLAVYTATCLYVPAIGIGTVYAIYNYPTAAIIGYITYRMIL
jgi:hypothetical protein